MRIAALVVALSIALIPLAARADDVSAARDVIRAQEQGLYP